MRPFMLSGSGQGVAVVASLPLHIAAYGFRADGPGHGTVGLMPNSAQRSRHCSMDSPRSMYGLGLRTLVRSITAPHGQSCRAGLSLGSARPPPTHSTGWRWRVVPTAPPACLG